VIHFAIQSAVVATNLANAQAGLNRSARVAESHLDFQNKFDGRSAGSRNSDLSRFGPQQPAQLSTNRFVVLQ